MAYTICTQPETTADRKAFYQRIDGENLAPLWEVLGDLVPPTPMCRCRNQKSTDWG